MKSKQTLEQQQQQKICVKIIHIKIEKRKADTAWFYWNDKIWIIKLTHTFEAIEHQQQVDEIDWVTQNSSEEIE